MAKQAAHSLRLCAWVLTGVALDGAALVGLLKLLAAAGSPDTGLVVWLLAVGLVTAPWLVHVITCH